MKLEEMKIAMPVPDIRAMVDDADQDHEISIDDITAFIQAKWRNRTCHHCESDRWEPADAGNLASATVALQCANCGIVLNIAAKAISSSKQEAASSYCIAPRYRHRDTPVYFNDTENTDEWQKEVYEYARDVMKLMALRTVFDIGCGSGFKLIEYLGEFDTIGFDLEPTVSFLRTTYPDRKWELSDFDNRHALSPDLVICSDVIEHVPDPDRLVGHILALRPRFVVFSTPDRELAYPDGSPFLLGPPRNMTHLREWNFPEFGRYISRSFHVIDHRISNRQQATQLIFCSPKRGC